MLDTHKLTNITRMTKKSLNNKPLPIIRAQAQNLNHALDLEKNKIRIFLTIYRVERWTVEPKPLQCQNCNQLGHNKNVCPNPKACPLCTGNHIMNECRSRTQKCVNCSQKHPSLSRECEILKNRRKHMLPAPTVTEKNHDIEFNDDLVDLNELNIKRFRLSI